MIWVADTTHKKKCTVIQSLHGEVKLIKRSYKSRPSLVVLCFSNLKDCLEYVDKNQFQINTMYSGHPRLPVGRDTRKREAVYT